MANIVELREMSGEKLAEMLEDSREEMFNLRFQKASARLEDTTRLKHVRREVAQLRTVLNMRQLAKDTAVMEPAVAEALAGKEWRSTARFDYEESAWRVVFVDSDDDELATVVIDLNRHRPRGRRGRQLSQPVESIQSYEIAE